MLFGGQTPAAASCLWQTGLLPNNTLFPIPASVKAFSPTDIWAADNADRSILHWDGAAWSVVSIPVSTPPNSITSALAVTGTSDNDLWVDGLVRTDTEQYSKSLHFDGNRWNVARMPSGFNQKKI
jgi:hypothetical protein